MYAKKFVIWFVVRFIRSVGQVHGDVQEVRHFLLVWAVIFKPRLLNISCIVFLDLSASLPVTFLNVARPSSLYSPMFPFPNLSLNLSNWNSPTSSHTSAPS